MLGTLIQNTKERVTSIDALRGIVMLVMALDHARDFFSNFSGNLADFNQAGVALFLTRWITHFCAPVFIFLIGTGMAIAIGRGKSKSEIALFLLTRGLWMLFLELTIISFAWTFDPTIFTHPLCLVIWAIGWAMIVLAGLIFLPKPFIFIIGLIIVAGHNLLDGNEQALLGSLSWMHVQTLNVTLFGSSVVHFNILYPIIPLIGVPALGYVFGSVFFLSVKQREQWLWGVGFACIILFLILRTINIYGDPSGWSYQNDVVFTILSFINCTKYPASLSYLLMTLGPAILLMIWLERHNNVITRFFIVFGKVPFFYYILHLYLLRLLAILFSYLYYGQVEWVRVVLSTTLTSALGYPLPVVFLAWIVAVAMLYPLCRWYGAFKARHKDNIWLSYL